MDDDIDIIEGRENGCSQAEGTGIKVFFNPFDGATIEENNERIRKGWEVMPMRVPPMDRDLKKT